MSFLIPLSSASVALSYSYSSVFWIQEVHWRKRSDSRLPRNSSVSAVGPGLSRRWVHISNVWIILWLSADRHMSKGYSFKRFHMDIFWNANSRLFSSHCLNGIPELDGQSVDLNRSWSSSMLFSGKICIWLLAAKTDGVVIMICQFNSPLKTKPVCTAVPISMHHHYNMIRSRWTWRVFMAQHHVYKE